MKPNVLSRNIIIPSNSNTLPSCKLAKAFVSQGKCNIIGSMHNANPKIIPKTNTIVYFLSDIVKSSLFVLL